MAVDWADLARLARQVEEQSGTSLWEAFRDLKLSEEQMRAWLTELGFTPEDLADARSRVEGLVAGLGAEEKRQLAGMLRQVLGDKSTVPEEIWQLVERLEREA
ncbi:MAG: hypothetical protein ACPLRW_01795 [Moorellales bacterium]